MATYVWDTPDTLRDYSAGLVVVVGVETEAEAWEALTETASTAAFSLGGIPSVTGDFQEKISPRRVEGREAFVCWGGA